MPAEREQAKVDVFMQFFVSDYLTDTADLSCEEHGAYSLLLFHMWARGGSLPLDHERLARLCRVDLDTWDGIWEVIGHYFIRIEGPAITQKRLASELLKARKRKADAADNGRKGAQGRWAKPADGDPHGETMATPMATPSPEPWRNDGAPMALQSPISTLQSSTPEPTPQDPERADPPGDPRARAIPDLVADAWPEPEPEPVRYHQAVARAIKPNGLVRAAPGRDPPGVRAQKLVDLFGKVRSEVAQQNGGGAVPWHHGPKDFARARDFVEDLDRRDGTVTVGEIERTMRVHLEWAIAEPDRKHFEVGFAFAVWAHRFSDLLEQVREMRPRGLGLTEKDRRNVTNMQLWLDRTEGRQSDGPP
jgi:uncharacterized protein YdaU (DUF1376 family)